MVANEEDMDMICILMLILVMIIPFLGLLAMLENIVSNFKKVNSSKEDEVENTIFGKEYCVCFFCGKVCDIITKCSCCNNALYCSKVCHVMHGRFWHTDECLETEVAQDNEGSSSPSHGTPWLLLEPENEGTSKYSMNEDDEGEEGQNSNVYDDGCAVCGNSCSKKCSRCKAIKYCNKTGRAKKIVPRPPPVPYSRPVHPARFSNNMPASSPVRFSNNMPASSMEDERNQMVCAICLTNTKDLAFGCGHMTCRDCGSRISSCPICRQRITSRLRVFAG